MRGCGLKPEEYAIGIRARTSRPLEGAAEVAVAGEAEPTALGVADPQSLDRRRLLLGLLSHRVKASGVAPGPRLQVPPAPSGER